MTDSWAEKHLIEFRVRGPMEPDSRDVPTRQTITDVSVVCTKEEAAAVHAAVLRLLAGGESND